MAMLLLPARASVGASLCNAQALLSLDRLVKSSSSSPSSSAISFAALLHHRRKQQQQKWSTKQGKQREQQHRSIAATSCCLQPITTKQESDGKSDPKELLLLQQAFEELQMKLNNQEMVGRVRVRQHVNPLKASLMAPLEPVQWKAVFVDCSLPLFVDIGCGSGRLVMILAKSTSGTQNYLGLDIRERLVDRAKLWAGELDVSSNVHFITTNATVAFDSLLASYPGPLAFVSILCPDPHFKRRHQKRKVVQKQLVDAIIHHLKPGGGIFLQSDVKDVALYMRAQFDEHLGSSLLVATGDGRDGLVKPDSEGWVEENPLGVPSEREALVLATGGHVYRVVYRRI